MTNTEEHAMSFAKFCRQHAEEWMMTDDPLLHSEMLNYNMIEKEGTGHAVLAIRTRVSHEEHAAGGEVSMFDNEVSEAKIENDRELPTTVKSYETYGNTGMDPDLTINSRAFLDEHPANGEVTMTDNEALVDSKVIDEDLAAAVISYEAYGHTEQDRNPAPKPCSNSKHYTPKSFNEAITYLEKVQTRFASRPEIYYEFLQIIKAFEACPAPGPVQETHEKIGMLFENQKDLVRGFEEWLPRPCDCIGEHEMSIQDPVKLEERVYDLEKRVVGVENVVKGFGEANGEVEEEIVELRHEVMMLMGENKTLRDRVQQLDNYEAGPRFVAMREQQLLKKEVEEMKFENEQLKKAVAELRGCICFE